MRSEPVKLCPYAREALLYNPMSSVLKGEVEERHPLACREEGCAAWSKAREICQRALSRED